MKKILFACLAAMLMCSCGQQFGLAYGVSLSGVGDGKFDVTFPQGSFAMDGTAAIDFVIGDTIPFGTVTTKAEVLQSGDAKQRAALKAVNDSIAQQFGATGGDGTYDLWIHGFVKETGTGLIFEIDRHLTNRANAPAIRLAAKDDPFPYIK
jgi:hypothetical protein